MTNIYRNVSMALMLGIISLADILYSILLTINLFVDLDFMVEVSKVIKYYMMYIFTFYNVGLGIVSLFLVGSYNNLLLQIDHDRKGFYNKLAVVSYFILIDISAGSVYLILLFTQFIKTRNELLSKACFGIGIVWILATLLYFSMYILHPDLWNCKRRREINEIISETVTNT